MSETQKLLKNCRRYHTVDENASVTGAKAFLEKYLGVSVFEVLVFLISVFKVSVFVVLKSVHFILAQSGTSIEFRPLSF